MKNKAEAYSLVLVLAIALVAAIVFQITGNTKIIPTILFWTFLISIGLLAEAFYRTAKIQRLKQAILVITLISALGSAYLATLSIYYIIPAVITLLPLLSYRSANRFFGASFLLSFAAFISFINTVFSSPVQVGAFVWLSLFMLFNSFFSIASYLMKSYKDLDKQPKKTKRKSYVLKVPIAWFIIPGVFLLLALLGVYAAFVAIDNGPYGSLAGVIFTLLMVGLTVIAGRTLNRISIDGKELVVKGMLFPKKDVTKISSIKKATIKTIPAAYGYNTLLLEIHTNKGVKRIDIRMNYNYKDTMQFLAVAKSVLGRKFKKGK